MAGDEMTGKVCSPYEFSRPTAAPRCLACGQEMRYEGRTVNPASLCAGRLPTPGERYYCGRCNAWRLMPPSKPGTSVEVNG